MVASWNTTGSWIMSLLKIAGVVGCTRCWMPEWRRTGATQKQEQHQVAQTMSIFSRSVSYTTIHLYFPVIFLHLCVDEVNYQTLPLGSNYTDLASSNSVTWSRREQCNFGRMAVTLVAVFVHTELYVYWPSVQKHIGNSAEQKQCLHAWLQHGLVVSHACLQIVVFWTRVGTM